MSLFTTSTLSEMPSRERLGELDLDTFAEFGSTMQGLLTGPPADMHSPFLPMSP